MITKSVKWSHLLVSLLTLATLFACQKKDAAEMTDGSVKVAETTALTVYSGRSKTMVQGLFDTFARETGIKVEVRYGDTTSLANMLLEEGDASPADLFFAQDAGALGALRAAGRFIPLSEATVAKVDSRFVASDRTWVGVSGRSRVVTYNTDRLKPEDLPSSIDGFTDPKWKGRIGWPPSNASFQAFISAMRITRGEEATRAWLDGILANEPKVYPSNNPALKAVAAGEVDVAFLNHYYLYRQLKEHQGSSFPAANYQPTQDVGGMMNVSGLGILKTSKKQEAAQKLVDYLLSEPAQKVFTEDNFEYPLASGLKASSALPPLSEMQLLPLDLGELRDLEATLKLLRETKVLP